MTNVIDHYYTERDMMDYEEVLPPKKAFELVSRPMAHMPKRKDAMDLELPRIPLAQVITIDSDEGESEDDADSSGGALRSPRPHRHTKRRNNKPRASAPAQQYPGTEVYQSITMLPKASDKSFEELRLECYQLAADVMGDERPWYADRPSEVIPPIFKPCVVKKDSAAKDVTMSDTPSMACAFTFGRSQL